MWLFLQWVAYLGVALLLGLWMGWMLWRRPGRVERASIESELVELRAERAALRLRLADAERRVSPARGGERVELDLRDRVDLVSAEDSERVR